MLNIFEKILRAGEGKVLKEIQLIVDGVNELEDDYAALSDDELRGLTDEFRERLEDEDYELDELEVEAYALVREASKRVLGQRHYDVQLMGGGTLHRGMIAEMKTGEGKTLVSTLAAYLNALSGDGVHIVTVNDYLAKYQSELMGRIHRFLGLTVGCITNDMPANKRKEQYDCDITYGTNNEFGFDYLRDNMSNTKEEQVQRGFNFAIVDEVDSILIDEARTPLIISGAAMSTDDAMYKKFAVIANKLKIDEDYEVDKKKKTVGIKEKGIEKIEQLLGVDNLYNSINTDLVGYANNAIKAKELFEIDKDYIVQNGELNIVDEHTGRVLDGRRYSEGMHQALEAKEHVEIKKENQTYATITLQNYFRMYDKLSGMTGTAETEAAEFMDTYKLGVVPIPTNQPMIREDKPDFVFKNLKGKYTAMVRDIEVRYKSGQPVLIGTASVEKSEEISKLLDEKQIPHNLLNAKNHTKEAALVAMAGRKSTITVATNMAGRGTDIMLGGNSEFLAIETMAKEGYDPIEEPDKYNADYPKFLEKAKKQVEKDHDEVTALGGLYVLGTERHESRRIDNQLRGRAGRQGDPGESRFYISFEDDLMKVFNTAMAQQVMALSLEDDVPLEMKMISKSIQRAQAQIEGRNQEMRKNILKYDEVMNKQREIVYEQRQLALEGKDLAKTIQSFIKTLLQETIDAGLTSEVVDEEVVNSLELEIKNLYPIRISLGELVHGEFGLLTPDIAYNAVLEDLENYYSEREELVSEENMRSLERQVVLGILDRLWREHLYAVDYLKEGIGLRAMAQKDPLVEYKSETARMFNDMNYTLKVDTLKTLLNYPMILTPDKQILISTEESFYDNSKLNYNDPDEVLAQGITSSGSGVFQLGDPTDTSETGEGQAAKPKVVQAKKANSDGNAYYGTKPNDPCPCGSGKKYKMCHGKNDPAITNAKVAQGKNKGKGKKK
jgi:preprotein translocase subunit SecA